MLIDEAFPLRFMRHHRNVKVFLDLILDISSSGHGCIGTFLIIEFLIAKNDFITFHSFFERLLQFISRFQWFFLSKLNFRYVFDIKEKVFLQCLYA